ncbi:MAG: PKD domain-containing protein [Flavobacteriales bacterium]|nr:PKD domain-containing protein [Flavobacteriales bacterium]
MMKDHDAFERSLKDALAHYEVPYNSADWAKLEQRLGAPRGKAWQTSAGLYVLLFAGSLAVATTLHQLFQEVNMVDGTGQGSGSILAETPETDSATAPSGLVLEQESVSVKAGTPSEASDDEHDRRSNRPRQPSTTPASPVAMPPSESGAGARPAVTSTASVVKPSITEGCPGTTVNFHLENIPDDGIHLWNFGDGSFSNKAKPTHTYAKAGTYEVTLSYSSLGGGNFANKPASDRIVIHEAPEAAFQFHRREFPNTVPSVHFENHSVHGKKFHWDFGDGHTSTIAHPDHVYKKKGDHVVTLTVTNDKGCVDRVERVVRIESDYELLAPKAFSPNDDGVNNQFMPEALRTLGAKFHMSIFDGSTGQLLYETNDPGRPWNGRISNRGDKCAPGEYVWVVEMKDGEKLGGTYNGKVSLVR